jgi:hypothetical protein
MRSVRFPADPFKDDAKSWADRRVAVARSGLLTGRREGLEDRGGSSQGMIYGNGGDPRFLAASRTKTGL